MGEEKKTEKCTIEDKARAFFRLRFGKSPMSDPSYFEEWLIRLQKEYPEGYMDKETLAIWKIVKNACSIGKKD